MNQSSNQLDNSRLLTIRETCNFLRCTRPTLAKLRKNSEIDEVKIVGKVLFKESDILELVQKNKGGLNK